MSFDNLSECKSCGAHMSTTMWMQFFRSAQEAEMYGQGPEFLSVFTLGPIAFKVNMCFGCKEINLSTDYTAEEEAALQERAQRHQKKMKTVADMGKLFGGIFGGPKPGEQEKTPDTGEKHG